MSSLDNSPSASASDDSGGESFSNALNSNSDDDWEMYEKEFDPKHFKKAKIGPDYQITDPLPIGDSQKGKVDQSAEVWNPDRISADNLGKYQLNFLISTFVVQIAILQI